MFEITWTIYSNSERSEQFLVTECFFNLFLEVSQLWKIRTIIIQIGKIIGIKKSAGKVRKHICFIFHAGTFFSPVYRRGEMWVISTTYYLPRLLKNDVKKRKERLSLELERKLTVWKLDTDEEWLLKSHPYITSANFWPF